MNATLRSNPVVATHFPIMRLERSRSAASAVGAQFLPQPGLQLHGMQHATRGNRRRRFSPPPLPRAPPDRLRTRRPPPRPRLRQARAFFAVSLCSGAPFAVFASRPCLEHPPFLFP